MLGLTTATGNSLETLLGTLDNVERVRKRVKPFLVDGDSTKGTLECFEAWVGRMDDTLLLSHDGSGLHQALNRGIQAVTDDPAATYVGLFHSDEVFIGPNVTLTNDNFVRIAINRF